MNYKKKATFDPKAHTMLRVTINSLCPLLLLQRSFSGVALHAMHFTEIPEFEMLLAACVLQATCKRLSNTFNKKASVWIFRCCHGALTLKYIADAIVIWSKHCIFLLPVSKHSDGPIKAIISFKKRLDVTHLELFVVISDEKLIWWTPCFFSITYHSVSTLQNMAQWLRFKSWVDMQDVLLQLTTVSAPVQHGRLEQGCW